MVTGAAGGIGQAIADALLQAGASVVVVDRDRRRVETVAERFGQERLRAFPVGCDLTSSDQIQSLVQTVTARYGRLHILVNAAGVSVEHSDAEYPDDAWRKTLEINLTAPFQLSKRLAPLMKGQGGSIINITSINAERGFAGNPAYIASKGGLKQLTKSLAVDLAPMGIRVNNVGPGYFHTAMTCRSWHDPARREQVAEHTLVHRWGEPSDLAGTIILLASDASRYITGADFYVDGGWLTKGF